MTWVQADALHWRFSWLRCSRCKCPLSRNFRVYPSPQKGQMWGNTPEWVVRCLSSNPLVLNDAVHSPHWYFFSLLCLPLWHSIFLLLWKHLPHKSHMKSNSPVWSFICFSNALKSAIIRPQSVHSTWNIPEYKRQFMKNRLLDTGTCKRDGWEGGDQLLEERMISNRWGGGKY